LASTLQDLVRVHLAIVAMLEGNILSSATRDQLQKFRDDIEKEIAQTKASQSGTSKADEIAAD
jgi:hypothetical protein